MSNGSVNALMLLHLFPICAILLAYLHVTISANKIHYKQFIVGRGDQALGGKRNMLLEQEKKNEFTMDNGQEKK